MKKTIFVFALILFLAAGFASAVSQEELNEAKSLIDSKTDCKTLSNDQLEIIGEYYMEQMHPGEAHKLMHQMMGLQEGSDAEKQFHINMAQRIYCNQGYGTGYGMMGMMGGGMMSMMSGGMMNSNYGGGRMAYGMMGYGTGWMWLAGIFWFIVAVFVFSAIFWLTYNWLF